MPFRLLTDEEREHLPAAVTADLVRVAEFEGEKFVVPHSAAQR